MEAEAEALEFYLSKHWSRVLAIVCALKSLGSYFFPSGLFSALDTQNTG